MNPARILVVEDELILAEDMARLLKESGHEIVGIAPSGEDAIRLALETRPDLLLMDIKLKTQMDGIQAAGLIRSEFDPAVIFLTAHSDEELFERAKATDPWVYLSKPVLPIELTRNVEMVLLKHQLSKRVKESEERLRSILSSMDDCVLVFDKSGIFVECHEGGNGCGLPPLPHEMILGRHFTEILPSRAAGLLQDAFAALTVEGQTQAFDYSVKKDDKEHWFSAKVSMVRGPHGEFAGAAVVARDITELKRARDELEFKVKKRTSERQAAIDQLREEAAARIQAESASRETGERLRAIGETATDSIFIKDQSLKYVFVNPAFCNLVGLPAESILESSDSDLFGLDAADHSGELERRVLAGEVVEEEHTRLVQGSPATFLDIRAPMRDELGAIIGVCGISRNITERKQTSSTARLATEEYPSSAMRSTMTAARLAAQTDSICLVTGESGSGKDRLARYIHDHSKRSGGPFYSINCAAIPRELAESELFGYEAGAFTGATRRKRGLIELAEGGTLLLNEISELPLELQSKMLAFLDTMSITRVGGQKSISVNVRLIAATNLDLLKEMAEGRFRRDLFYRLNVFTIMMPPLRDRLEDIPLLVDLILSELVSQMGLSEVPQADRAIIERLRRYPWPGNVRELRNVFERALILSQGRSLLAQDIVLEPGQSAIEHGTPVLRPETPLNQALGSLQRSLIEEALTRCEGNKKKAAEALGISRYALARYMRKLDLSER